MKKRLLLDFAFCRFSIRQAWRPSPQVKWHPAALTGTFASGGPDQRDGALLAIDVVNKRGRAQYARRKVMVEGVIGDDRAPSRTSGVRRYPLRWSPRASRRVGGHTWSAARVRGNAIVDKEPMPTSRCADVMAKESLPEGQARTNSTFATAFSP